MIVVDNSILVPAIVAAHSSSDARRVAAHDYRWILPPLWRYEFTNSIATLLRAGTIGRDMAYEAISDAHTLVANREVAVDQNNALRLSALFSVSGYDAQYLALAEAYGIKCVTNDKKMARQAPVLAVLMEEYLA